MKKKMTKKELEEYIEGRLGDVDNGGCLRGRHIEPLCSVMPFNSGWDEHWQKINTRKHPTMAFYFRHDCIYEEVSFLRLLSLHLFIRGL